MPDDAIITEITNAAERRLKTAHDVFIDARLGVISRLMDNGRRTEEQATELIENLEGGIQRIADGTGATQGQAARAMREAIESESEYEEA